MTRQELLAFLLNGLNEDLNRIADKPYIEQPDSDGRSDAELADIWWKNHLRREFSIVVALFAGQFKSVLACRECGYESARFEPFMFLQVCGDDGGGSGGGGCVGVGVGVGCLVLCRESVQRKTRNALVLYSGCYATRPVSRPWFIRCVASFGLMYHIALLPTCRPR